jgi:hypothetical protein
MSSPYTEKAFQFFDLPHTHAHLFPDGDTHDTHLLNIFYFFFLSFIYNMQSGSLYFDNAEQSLTVDVVNALAQTVDIATILDLTTQTTFTIECYIYPTSSDGDNITLFCSTLFYNPYNTNARFGFDVNSNLMFFYFIDKNDIAHTIIGTGQPIPLNTWTHMALSVDAGKVRMFIQGIKLDLTDDVTFTGSRGSDSLIRIANWVNNDTNRFNLKGNLTNYRINTNSLYSQNFTPAYPLTEILGTTLLLLTNSNEPIISSTSNNVIVTNESNVTWSLLPEFQLRPQTLIWHSFTMTLLSNSSFLFNGFFSVDPSNLIQNFYYVSENNRYVDILLRHIGDYESDNSFINGDFSSSGTNILNVIPFFNNNYNNPYKLQLGTGNYISYSHISTFIDSSWTVIDPPITLNTIQQISGLPTLYPPLRPVIETVATITNLFLDIVSTTPTLLKPTDNQITLHISDISYNTVTNTILIDEYKQIINSSNNQNNINISNSRKNIIITNLLRAIIQSNTDSNGDIQINSSTSIVIDKNILPPTPATEIIISNNIRLVSALSSTDSSLNHIKNTTLEINSEGFSIYTAIMVALEINDNIQFTFDGSNVLYIEKTSDISYNIIENDNIIDTDKNPLINYSFIMNNKIFNYVLGSGTLQIGVTFNDGIFNYIPITLSSYINPINVHNAVLGNSISGDITIPATVNNVDAIGTSVTYNVVSIDTNAFSNCTSLTSLTVPNSVTSIGSNAFQNCTSLNKINYSNITFNNSNDFINYVNNGIYPPIYLNKGWNLFGTSSNIVITDPSFIIIPNTIYTFDTTTNTTPINNNVLEGQRGYYIKTSNAGSITYMVTTNSSTFL